MCAELLLVTPMPDAPLLDIRNLAIDFAGETGTTQAVKGISFTMQKGETLAIVGESGSGKSVTGLALTRLLPEPPAIYRSGEILLNGHILKSMTCSLSGSKNMPLIVKSRRWASSSGVQNCTESGRRPSL